MRAKYARNPDAYRGRSAAWRAKNPDKVKAMSRLWVAALPDAYLRKSLRVTGIEVPPTLIEAKRAQLKIIRLLKEKT